MRTVKRWEKIPAAEVRKLAPGARVRIHSFDRYGYPCFRECRVITWGKTVKLRDDSPYAEETLSVTRETDRRWYAVEVEEMYE